MIMQYEAYNEQLELLGVLDQYLYSMWSDEYYGSGEFTLHTARTPENISMLKTGHRLWQQGKRTSVIIKYVREERGIIVVHGVNAIERLNQRIIEPTLSISNVEQGMRNIVWNNRRGLERLALGTVKGYSETHNTQFRGKELVEALSDLSTVSDIGCYLRFDPANRQDVFEVEKGADYTEGEDIKLFSEEWRSINDMITRDDISLYKNVAYVAGSEEGAARTIVIVGNATGDERHELWVDARDISPRDISAQEYRNQLTARGVERLAERKRFTSFEIELDGNVGEKVICQGFGFTLKVRIMAVAEEIEDNVLTTRCTVGEPQITAIDEIRIRNG